MHADLNLVLAVLKASDTLKRRAETWLAKAAERPVVPYAVGIELLLWCAKYDVPFLDSVGACREHFDVENADVLATAARALQDKDVPTVFDAVHLATALHAGTSLVTADERLWRTSYPTERS